MNNMIKELCKYLPYKVKVLVKSTNGDSFTATLVGVDLGTGIVKVLEDGSNTRHEVPFDVVFPYLRPMSSMTEDEVKELVKVRLKKYGADSYYNKSLKDIYCINHFTKSDWSAWIRYGEGNDVRVTCVIVGRVHWDTTLEEIEWLLEHHFDFMDLIDNHLAVKAPEGMYND